MCPFHQGLQGTGPGAVVGLAALVPAFDKACLAQLREGGTHGPEIEPRLGARLRQVFQFVDAGFQRAYATIMDSNVTALMS